MADAVSMGADLTVRSTNDRSVADGSARQSSVYSDANDQRLRMFLVDSFTGYNSKSIFVQFDGFSATTESQSVQLDTWHHVALVFESGSIEVYIDGRQQELRGYAGSNMNLSYAASLPFRIGNNARGDRQFSGFFDEVMVWDRALSAQEIRDLIR